MAAHVRKIIRQKQAEKSHCFSSMFSLLDNNSALKFSRMSSLAEVNMNEYTESVFYMHFPQDSDKISKNNNTFRLLYFLNTQT